MKENLRDVLAYNLRVERAKTNITQETLAEKAGISAKYLTDIENMKVCPSILIVYNLAKAFNLTVNDLVYKK